MNDSPFYKFLELAKFDRTLAALEKDIKHKQQEIDQLGHKKTEIAAQVEQAKQYWHTVKKEVDAKELAMSELDLADADKKQKLENVKSHKEYGALALEIAEVKEQQSVLEQQLIDLWNALEASKRAYELAQKKAAEDQVAVDAAIEQKHQIMAQEQAIIDVQKGLRVQKLQDIPQEWLDKYDAMLSSVPDPVAPVVEGNCSACFYKVTGQDMILLGRNKLLQCKDCYRFLYIPQPGSSEEQAVHKQQK